MTSPSSNPCFHAFHALFHQHARQHRYKHEWWRAVSACLRSAPPARATHYLTYCPRSPRVHRRRPGLSPAFRHGALSPPDQPAISNVAGVQSQGTSGEKSSTSPEPSTRGPSPNRATVYVVVVVVVVVVVTRQARQVSHPWSAHSTLLVVARI